MFQSEFTYCWIYHFHWIDYCAWNQTSRSTIELLPPCRFCKWQLFGFEISQFRLSIINLSFVFQMTFMTYACIFFFSVLSELFLICFRQSLRHTLLVQLVSKVFVFCSCGKEYETSQILKFSMHYFCMLFHNHFSILHKIIKLEITKISSTIVLTSGTFQWHIQNPGKHIRRNILRKQLTILAKQYILSL